MNSNDRLTLKQAVQLIAPRVGRSDEDTRDVENRTSHRIGYAVKTGKLQQEKDGSFTLANLTFWASSKWPGKFNDLPAIGRAYLTFPMMTLSGSISDSMPNSIEECQLRLKEAQQRIATLEKENFDLKPDAEKYRANCKKNSRNAQIKGRGKI